MTLSLPRKGSLGFPHPHWKTALPGPAGRGVAGDTAPQPCVPAAHLPGGAGGRGPGRGRGGGAATTGRVWEPARPASRRNLRGNRHWVPGTMGKLVVLTLLGVGLALLGERFVALR